MEYHIWRDLIQILSYRNDLIDTIKPFFGQLRNNNNNTIYTINDRKHIPFLKSFTHFQHEILYHYEIIKEEIYADLVPKPKISPINLLESSNPDEEIVKEIIKGDKIKELQRLINEKGINAISPIIGSFIEVGRMEIPIIAECIIQKATKCFKFLLINGIEDPSKTLEERVFFSSEHRFEWDCMGIAIYYGDVENITILEEYNIEKGNNPGHIEAAIFSYRNGFVKAITNKMKEEDENMNNEILKIGLFAAAKNNNIKGAEILINKGANIHAKDIVSYIILVLNLINVI